MVGSLERTSTRRDSEAALLEDAGRRPDAVRTRPLTDSRRTADAGPDSPRRRAGDGDAEDEEMESGSRSAADPDSSAGLYVTQSSQSPANTATRTATTTRCSGHRSSSLRIPALVDSEMS